MTQGRRRLPEVLTDDERQALLQVPNKRWPSGQRNQAILQIMLNTGLRLAEIVNLKWQHIDLNTGKLMVREGKGKKDRSLWLGDEDLKLLQSWRERQAKISKNPEFVFTGIAKGKENNPVCRRYLQGMIKRYAKRAGINKTVSMHTLRHTFATDIYRETKNIRLTQKALGHSDLSTTMIYTFIHDEELEEALKSFRYTKEAV